VRSPCVQWSHITREYGEEREHGGKGVLLRSPCFAQRFMHIRGVKRGLLETTSICTFPTHIRYNMNWLGEENAERGVEQGCNTQATSTYT
jgi:hypothetical protein